MATLSVDKPRVYSLTGAHPEYNEVPAIAADIIYEGAAVGQSSSTGTYRPLVAGDTFGGFSQERCDNSAGTAAAKDIKILESGYVWLSITGATGIVDLEDAVYAFDDDTFTKSSSSSAVQIGKIVRYDATRTNSSSFTSNRPVVGRSNDIDGDRVGLIT